MAEGRRYTPERDALPEDYFELLKAHDLDGALLVQPSFLGADNRFLLDVLAASRRSDSTPRLWGVAVLDPATPASDMRALRTSGIVGIRLNCVGRPIPDLDSSLWSKHLGRVEALGWHVELHLEGQRLAPVLDRLLTSNSRVVVDHFGLPDAESPARCPGFRELLGRHDTGLSVKLSAPYRVFPDCPVELAAQKCGDLARMLMSSLGPERLIWGSDWPWTQHEDGQTYRDCVDWGFDWFHGVAAMPGDVAGVLINR